ncbi:MAG: hypothetical protein WC223_11060 [Bacteroidales bacterium]|jgi:hypothetical protein
MKELDNLVAELKEYLLSKELELKKNPKFDTYTRGHLLNRENEIKGFEIACREYEKDPFMKTKIINNFRKKAYEIKTEIDKITL